MATHFSKAALVFLRGLKKNNDREWFAERKEIYERELKAPMLALIDEVNHAMAEFAPGHVRPAPKTMMRIYRDIRFSPDKRPYKNHVSAWWAREGMAKTSGAGYYFHVAGNEVIVAAGVFMPDREQLLAIRRHLSAHHAEFRAVMKSRKLKTLMPDEETARMTRVPKGFAPDDPAADIISRKQWGISATLPTEEALSASLIKSVVERFRIAAPLVEILNAPFASSKRKPLF